MLQSEMCDDPLLRASLLSMLPKSLDVATEVQSPSHDCFFEGWASHISFLSSHIMCIDLLLIQNRDSAWLTSVAAWFVTLFGTIIDTPFDSAGECRLSSITYRACGLRQLQQALDTRHASISVVNMLFVALCRALGLTTRFIAPLRPIPLQPGRQIKVNEPFTTDGAVCACHGKQRTIWNTRRL
jgi:hypothetical protein